jgi:succinate-semialdehyde dehydrogenase/glutarate-semialdehyde dehydrogenase
MGISTQLRERLKDASLLTDMALVGGRWRAESTSGQRFDVHNPATGEVIANLPDIGIDEVREAIDAAWAAQRDWARRTGIQRSRVLKKWHALWLEHADDLAVILTSEQGKPLSEARGEILYGASFLEWFAEEAKRVYGDTIPGHTESARIIVLKQPVGVVGAITPWNFPNAMIARKVAPALAVGCAMVAKPARETPLSMLALAVLAGRAGLPAELFSVLTMAGGSAFGKELSSNPKIAKITFTGSTEVGRTLMRQGAEQIKRLGLELGGNAPFIVFDDADLDAAVEGAIASKYRNAGQTCVCANRLYVQDGVYDAFVERLAARVSTLRVGNGLDPDTAVGPLINQKGVEKVETHLADALARGARVVRGGHRSTLGPLYFEPTVLADVTQQMLVAREETFGPLAPVIRFNTEEEAIAMANDSEFGLAGYFFARDIGKVFRVAEAMQVGMVGVNTGMISTEVAPFGGVKQSGIGREGSKYGIDDYLDIKYVCLGIAS